MNYQKKNLKKVFEINADHILSETEKKSLYKDIIKDARRKRIINYLWGATSIAAILILGLILLNKEDQNTDFNIREFAIKSQSIISKSDSIQIASINSNKNHISEKDIHVYNVNADSSLDSQEGKYLTVYVPYGKRMDFHLPDGSMVWLNSGSYLTFNNDMENEREVYLNGEGYFNIKHTGQKFVVHTKSSDIKVLGTSFNACSYEDENAFSVELLTGKVELISHEKKFLAFQMHPGEKVSIDTKTFKVEKSLGIDGNDILWTKKQLSLKNASMSDILRKMERIYNVKIHANQSVYNMNISYSGRLNVDVDIVTSLSSIYELNNYDIKLKEKEVYITTKYN